MSKIDLSGTWTLSCNKPGFQAIPARIPGENCSALIDAGLVPDPYVGLQEKDLQWVREFDWTWSRDFELDPGFLDQKRIWLNADSLDTVGEIRINGKTVLHSRRWRRGRAWTISAAGNSSTTMPDGFMLP